MRSEPSPSGWGSIGVAFSAFIPREEVINYTEKCKSLLPIAARPFACAAARVLRHAHAGGRLAQTELRLIMTSSHHGQRTVPSATTVVPRLRWQPSPAGGGLLGARRVSSSPKAHALSLSPGDTNNFVRSQKVFGPGSLNVSDNSSRGRPSPLLSSGCCPAGRWRPKGAFQPANNAIAVIVPACCQKCVSGKTKLALFFMGLCRHQVAQAWQPHRDRGHVPETVLTFWGIKLIFREPLGNYKPAHSTAEQVKSRRHSRFVT